MDNKINIVPSSVEDVFELANNLRNDDIAECLACGQTPFQSLLEGYMWSECHSAKIFGKTEAMFGVSSYRQPKGFALVWYLGSNKSFKYPVSLTEGGREFVSKWLQKFKVLYNITDKRNKRHVAWLKHIGFTFVDSVDVNGHEFLRFYKTREG